MTVAEAREKILEKNTPDEMKIQLSILEKVSELNAILVSKKPTELFRDHTCSMLYNKILELQASQHFASTTWKIIAYATVVPMVNTVYVFTAPVFHTRKIPLFFSWPLSTKYQHPDSNLVPNVVSKNDVEQQIDISLVEQPTPITEKFCDWLNKSSLENLDESNSSSVDSGHTVLSNGSSVDSGRTIIGPVMDAHDISTVTVNNETTPDSYLDISFMSYKRPNLSKQQKINILEGPSSNHSTPIRIKPELRPKLSSTFKKSVPQKSQKTSISKNNYITEFLNKWFKAQIANISQELQHEIEKMD